MCELVRMDKLGRMRLGLRWRRLVCRTNVFRNRNVRRGKSKGTQLQFIRLCRMEQLGAVVTLFRSVRDIWIDEAAERMRWNGRLHRNAGRNGHVQHGRMRKLGRMGKLEFLFKRMRRGRTETETGMRRDWRMRRWRGGGGRAMCNGQMCSLAGMERLRDMFRVLRGRGTSEKPGMCRRWGM